MTRLLCTLILMAPFGAGSAAAGGMTVMEPVQIVEDTSTSSHDFVVPLLVLAVIAAAVSD